jgi:glycosyltransferase involved in cell wall biosynthesis
MLVSIIIPVYNSSPYLKRCLDSVLAQTYTDFELLIIDDGSEDDSLSICRKYEQQDRRIKVFSKQNGGVSSARNVGLAHASGQWLCFIDSDDYVEKNHLEELVADIEDNVDFIMHGKHGLPKYSQSNYYFKIVDTDNKQELFEEIKISPNGQVYSKLFRYAIIKKYNISFPEDVKLCEDVLFVLKYLSKVDKLKFRNIITYHYIYHKNSLYSRQVLNYQSNYVGFKKFNNILYHDFNLSTIDTYTHLKRTYFNFLFRAMDALHLNGYSKSERLNKYEALNTCIKFNKISVDYRSYGIKYMYNLFFNQNYKSFDLLVDSLHRRNLLYKFLDVLNN